jgi:SAM-dependent methyltransferase
MKANKKARRLSKAELADKHALYESSVQCAEADIDFVDDTFSQLRGRRASRLREDFCGTAITACEWVGRRGDNIAIGVDLDAEVLQWGRSHNVASLKPKQRARVKLLNDNVLTAETEPVDVVLAMNFSYWCFKERATLQQYFEAARRSLADDGILFLDAYGGYDAFRTLKEKTQYGDFSYIWEQAAYNAVNGEFLTHIHFKFDDGSKLKKAFTYDWRLWTLVEIRELLQAAGFSNVATYFHGWDEETGESDGNFLPGLAVDAEAGWQAYITAEK